MRPERRNIWKSTRKSEYMCNVDADVDFFDNFALGKLILVKHPMNQQERGWHEDDERGKKEKETMSPV